MVISHRFFKFQGAGNDFILFDLRLSTLSLSRERISTLCDRRFGIGADGVILIKPSDEVDAEMIYFNADGGRVSFCGNGFRCFVAYLAQTKKERGEDPEGEYHVLCEGNYLKATYRGGEIQTVFPSPRLLHAEILLEGRKMDVVEVGVPHALLFMRQEEEIEVNSLGKVFRQHRFFSPFGVNVNFIWIEDKRSMIVRTFERGVEQETLSCASGSAAAVYMAHLRGCVETPVSVMREKKTLFQVDIRKDKKESTPLEKGDNLLLLAREELMITGTAQRVFEGVISES